MSPEWPPLEVLIDGGASPSFGHLKRPVCSRLGLTLDRGLIFKFIQHTNTWAHITPGMKATGNSTAKAKGAKKIENITLMPYGFKEGDLVCACEAPSGCIEDPSLVTTFLISRPEDHCLQALRKKETERKKAARAGGDSGYASTKKARKAVEVALSLGGNLDFSDDEEDGAFAEESS